MWKLPKFFIYNMPRSRNSSNFGLLEKLEYSPDCHSGDHGFKSRIDRNQKLVRGIKMKVLKKIFLFIKKAFLLLTEESPKDRNCLNCGWRNSKDRYACKLCSPTDLSEWIP